MANVIQIKRRAAGGSAGAPSSLKSGELAYNEADGSLYYGFGDNGSGQATSIIKIAGPDAFVSIAGTQTVTGDKTFSGAINVPTPTLGTHAATKAYVDAGIEGLDIKASVLVATTANITLAGAQTIDGVSVNDGDRVIVKNQTNQTENGIYSVNSSGAWPRTSDANTWDELVHAFAFVESGTANGSTSWVCTIQAGGTLGTNNVTFTQFGSASTYTAGTGLTLSGNEFSITNTAVTAGSYGGVAKSLQATVNAQGQLTALAEAEINLDCGTF